MADEVKGDSIPVLLFRAIISLIALGGATALIAAAIEFW
jgi:hypothetical protein